MPMLINIMLVCSRANHWTGKKIVQGSKIDASQCVGTREPLYGFSHYIKIGVPCLRQTMY